MKRSFSPDNASPLFSVFTEIKLKGFNTHHRGKSIHFFQQLHDWRNSSRLKELTEKLKFIRLTLMALLTKKKVM